MKEYNFEIVYHKGTLNTNADALSRIPTPTPVAMTSSRKQTTEIQQAQQKDSVLYKISHALSLLKEKPMDPKWKQPLFKRYMQLWHQFSLVDGVIRCTYHPSHTSSSVVVPLIPPSLQHQFLYQAHNVPSAGHQGYLKILTRSKQEGYWLGMANDVQRYCQECNTCQKSKLPSPTRAPLVNIPIGNLWEMLAVDILEVPV